ncbi:MAG: tannase/feruloyl esterase family alpha/beta hydrolase, partial [Acidobacteria bacterium]|nr:tannase/feruloyl esterase family alpha/beta hydrolase [Acidobacteriota bacterium]
MPFRILFLIAAPLAAAQQPCESLAQLKLNKVEVKSAVKDGPLCAVAAVARPTKDSEIRFEVWMPVENWNGRYQQFGNGGWAGGINTNNLKRAAGLGYAAAGTDDGHQGSGTDASWAVGHPEKLIDFGHRAVHVTSVHAKAVIAAFYGKPAAKHYFIGCSDGGREALMEAQRYPEDFDGIIAGAPANDWSNLFTAFVWNEQALLGEPESTIPVAKLPAIQAAVLKACDHLDGVADGLLEDPRACRFEPAALLCEKDETNACLTNAQLTALTKIYNGPANPRTGRQIHGGFAPGTEALPGTWNGWITTDPPQRAAHFAFGNSFYGQAVFEDPKWDFRKLDFDADVEFGWRKAGIHINSTNPDLRSFRANGGKLIQYHGWGDAAIPAVDSIQYYDNVLSFFARYPDARSRAAAPVQDFYRLFL